jgi:VanZ family protein
MAFLPAVVLTVGIAVLSLWENPQVPPSLQLSDKIMHGLMYTFLAMTWMWPLTRIVRTRAITYLYVFLSVTLYGALMEILQRFCTLTRSGEMADIYADALGALLGLLIVFILAKISNVKCQMSNNK